MVTATQNGVTFVWKGRSHVSFLYTSLVESSSRPQFTCWRRSSSSPASRWGEQQRRRGSPFACRTETSNVNDVISWGRRFEDERRVADELSTRLLLVFGGMKWNYSKTMNTVTPLQMQRRSRMGTLYTTSQNTKLFQRKYCTLET